MSKAKFTSWYIKKVFKKIKYQWSLYKFSAYNHMIFEEDVEVRTIGRLSVGENTIVGSKSLLHCGGRKWCDYKGRIKIGKKSYIGPHSVLFGAGEIEIGNNVLLGPGVICVSHQHSYKELSKVMQDQPMEFGKITIEDDVWIGSRATILPNIKISRGSVIGAGAVVTKDIPPFSVAVGVPAKVIKSRGIVGVSSG